MTTETSALPWTQKYRPQTLSQVVGNTQAVKKLVTWLGDWDNATTGKGKRRKKAALLFGPPGTGKTVTVEAIANDYGYALVETNASDFRTAKQIERWISRSIGYHTLDLTLYRGKRRMILFDEIDGISGRGDRGGVGAIIQVIKQTQCPVLLTANDIYQPKLRNLRQYCFQVRFQKLSEEDVLSHLNYICETEGIEAEKEALLFLIRNAKGDMRVAINDLQALSQGQSVLTTKNIAVYARDEQVQTFDALRNFFSAKTWHDARRSIEEATIDYETMMLCVHESLPYQFRDADELASAYNLLSEANMFLRKAQRERVWKLMRYFFDLMTGIPFLRKRSWSSNYVRFSQMLVQMSKSRAQRKLRKEIGLLIGEKCHVSSSAAMQEIVPYIRAIFLANPQAAAEISEWLKLQEEMIEYLSPENAEQILRLSTRQ